MERVSSAITGHKKIIVTLFLAATLLSSILMLFVSINYDITDYLPEDAQSTRALEVMEQAFAQELPNLRVMLRGVSITEALSYKARLSALEGVSSVQWLDDVADVKTPIELMDSSRVLEYYRDGNAQLNLSVKKGHEASTVREIYALLGDTHAVSGDALNTATSQNVAKTELMKAMLILIPLILLILILSTESWLEPLLFLLTIGVAVLINLGTNILLGDISYITQAISPILQLAVSLDYAIFLLHSFAECRRENPDLRTAMCKAMRQSFSAVAASAATTLFGFLALIFMDFQLGPDLGVNLVKGILLSFLSVMVFLPALTLCCCKLLDKTRHRRILPPFRAVGSISSKVRIPCLVLVLVLLVPCFLAQGRNTFTYGMGDFSPASRSGMDTAAIDEVFGKSTAIALLVPRGEPAREQALVERLNSLPHVKDVLSYSDTVGTSIPAEYLDSSIANQFYSDQYARLILYTDTEQEGEEAFLLVRQVQQEADALYDGAVLSCGQSVNLFDMKNTVTADNKLVSLIAVLAIALVLLITFRSISLPLILLLTIEAAILINLSVNYFTGSPLNYIGYLVINTVQLGATVDYAILLTVNHMRRRASLGVKNAIYAALCDCFPSILTSASILAAAGFCLYATSSNPIVSELGLLLGRGTLLSLCLVMFLLPALLRLFDKVIAKTTLHANFAQEVSIK